MFPASHIQTERRNLTLLRDRLLLEEKREPDEVLAQYGSDITAAFKYLQRFRAFSYDQLTQEESYCAWDRSRVSCMMLLHGRTAATGTGYSWLSPAILQSVTQRRAQKRPVIFALCQSQSCMEKDVSAHAVLSILISQLLETNASILRNDTRYHNYSRAFSDPAWLTKQAKMPFAILQELLDLSSDMYILLDRVDRIGGDAYDFMNSLVSLLRDCRGRIKILLVASSNGYDRVGGKFPQELQDSIEDDLGSDRFWSLERNQ